MINLGFVICGIFTDDLYIMFFFNQIFTKGSFLSTTLHEINIEVTKDYNWGILTKKNMEECTWNFFPPEKLWSVPLVYD